MSAAIEPGMWVECLGLSGEIVGPRDPVPAPLLEKGSIHLVEEVWPAEEFEDGIAGLVLATVTPRYSCGQRHCYSASRFRPIYRPNSETFRALLTPAPEVALEDA